MKKQEKNGGYLGATFSSEDIRRLNDVVKSWLPDELSQYLKDPLDYHMTVKSGPSDKSFGTFTKEQLMAAQRFNDTDGVQVTMSGFVALWGANTDYVYIGPAVRKDASLSEIFTSMGAREGFVAHLSVCLVPKGLLEALRPNLKGVSHAWEDAKAFSDAVQDAFKITELNATSAILSKMVFEEFNTASQRGTLNSRPNLLNATLESMQVEESNKKQKVSTEQTEQTEQGAKETEYLLVTTTTTEEEKVLVVGNAEDFAQETF